jgi:hypothetical protein
MPFEILLFCSRSSGYDKETAFWDVRRCDLVAVRHVTSQSRSKRKMEPSRSSRRALRSLPICLAYSRTLKMEAVRSSESGLLQDYTALHPRRQTSLTYKLCDSPEDEFCDSKHHNFFILVLIGCYRNSFTFLFLHHNLA